MEFGVGSNLAGDVGCREGLGHKRQPFFNRFNRARERESLREQPETEWFEEPRP
jgi:hypothetical protein